MSTTQYPEGTKIYPWSLTEETQRGSRVPVIRRWVEYPDGKRKYERYPSRKYKHIRKIKKELSNLVIRLNGKNPEAYRVKKAVLFKHAYISPDLLDEYHEFLRTQIPSTKHADSEFSFLKKYFLNFFIVQMKDSDPLSWRQNQSVWAKSLLNKDDDIKDELRIFKEGEIRAAKSLKGIVNSANRFLKFLHNKRPSEVPPLQFSPISRASYKELEAQRKLRKVVTERHYINEKDWQLIERKLSPEIRSWAMLAYNYGLRLSESMALDFSSIRKGYLLVEKQLISTTNGETPKYGPLKGRNARKTPHWFCSPQECFKLIEGAQAQPLIHPSTLSRKWRCLMNELGLNYDFHDLRHTFVTRAIRSHTPVDVQRSVGHVNIETTMAYLKDDREMNDEIFQPRIRNVS